MKEIQLKNTEKLFGTSDFGDALVQELLAQRYSLPLQNFGNNGEWPDDKTLELEYVDAVKYNGAIEATLHAELDLVTCSACFGADKQKVKGKMLVLIDCESGHAQVKL